MTMSEHQNVAARPSADRQDKRSVAGRAAVVLRPAADVLEDADGITLHLDMPGVSHDRLAINADKNTLTIEGDMEIAMPDGMEALYAEVHSTVFRRSFALSGELDVDKTEANMKDGVLTLRIPKRSELRPRRVEVRAV
jgi:HSP20 family protein